MTATITVHGGLTAAPELRYSQSGVAIASGTVASTDRYLKDGEWRDGKKLFVRWSAFKDLAENIAASDLGKGAQVVVTGKLHTREYEDRDGQKRSSTELEVTDFAVSLKRATAAVARNASQSPQEARGGANGGGQALGDNYGNVGAQAGDSWNVSSMGGGSDDAPF